MIGTRIFYRRIIVSDKKGGVTDGKKGPSGFPVGNMLFFLLPLRTSAPFVLSLWFDRLTTSDLYLIRAELMSYAQSTLTSP